MITETRLTGPAHYPDQGSKPPLIGRFLQFIGMWVTLPGRKVIDRLMKKHSGFTLIEVVITLAVIAVLVALTVPSFRGTIQNNRATAQANELVSALNLARGESIKRGAPVTVCASTNTVSATPTCSGVNDWATGWVAFTDNNATGAPSVGTVLQVWEPLEGNPTLASGGGTATPFVRFAASGRVTPTTMFTLTLPDCTGNQRRQIDVAPMGRVSVNSMACP